MELDQNVVVYEIPQYNITKGAETQISLCWEGICIGAMWFTLPTRYLHLVGPVFQSTHKCVLSSPGK